MYNYFNDKGTIGFICDNCGRQVNGCSIVNGMKFCAKCYQETFGKDNQQNEIQQLKQQLEEKDKEIAHLKEKDNYHLRYELAGADETITNLKQQLEEKDKEIEKLKTKQELTFIHSKEDYFQRCNFLEEANIKLQFNQKQLAIQELEKVKNFVDGRTYCADYIKKRIKELEGENYEETRK